MTEGRWTIVGAVAATLFLGAVKPGGIGAAQPGLWDVSRSATGVNAERLCVADVATLAEWEDRSASCTRDQLSQDANQVVFDYRCTGGSFGRSTMTLLTPRSLRIETQGISGGGPFDYTLYARRVGPCRHR